MSQAKTCFFSPPPALLGQTGGDMAQRVSIVTANLLTRAN